MAEIPDRLAKLAGELVREATAARLAAERPGQSRRWSLLEVGALLQLLDQAAAECPRGHRSSPNGWCSVDDFAVANQVSPRTLRRWCARGRLTAARSERGQWRIWEQQ